MLQNQLIKMQKQSKGRNLRLLEPPLTGVSRLGELAHLQFFSPAVLLLHGRFSFDRFATFADELGRPLRLMSFSFKRPIFAGLKAPNGDTRWNNVLWAVHAEDDWPALYTFVLSSVSYSPRSTRYYGVGANRLTILDPIANEQLIAVGDLPTVEVTVFGVNGSHWRAGLVPASTIYEPPWLVWTRAGKDRQWSHEGLIHGT